MDGMEVVLTLGISELFNIPRMLVKATNNIVFGRTVRYIYDDQGKVVKVLCDGEWYHGRWSLTPEIDKSTAETK